jgi:hypothetical protein
VACSQKACRFSISLEQMRTILLLGQTALEHTPAFKCGTRTGTLTVYEITTIHLVI